MCTKLNIANTNSNVLLYLKLREEGCDKYKARQFCRKNFCKIDQTQKAIGPSGHKVLKLQPNKLQGNNGWQPGFMMKYDLGSGYRDSKDLIEENTEAERAILKQYDKYEKKKNAVLLQRMLAVKNYAESLKPPKIDVFSKNSLERIRKISQELRESQAQPKKYFQEGDTKFYALAEYLSKSNSSALLNFDPVLNSPHKFKTESSQHLAPLKSFRRQGTISALEKGVDFIMSLPITEDIDTKSSNNLEPRNLKHKLDLAEEFNSSQYLFTPSSAHTRQPSQLDQNDQAIKCFVQQFYDKQYGDDKVLPSTKRNLRLRAIADSGKPKQQIKSKRLSM